MKGPIKRILSLLLAAAALLMTSVGALARDGVKNETPVIFIAGFVSTPTIDAATGERVFPPDTEKIKEALGKYGASIAKAVITGNYADLESPLINASHQLLAPIVFDENGDPVNILTTTSYVRPDADEILSKKDPIRGYTSKNNIYYSFDWRLDLKTLSEQLHEFIEYVLDVTGAEKVDIIGSSMGGCLLITYMDRYECEHIRNAVFLSAAFQGASVCGEPFTGKYVTDAATLVTFLSSVTGRDLKGELINALIDALYQAGVVDKTAQIANDIYKYAMTSVSNQALSYIFGRLPGLWSLVPYDLYDTAKESFVPGIVTDEFYAKIDYYHEIQGRVPSIINSARDGGVAVSILSKYATSAIPAIPSQNGLTDMVVDTKYSSLGATCSFVNEPFDENYKQAVSDGQDRISPDRMIDASSCAFPDTTWFIKNIKHTAHPDAEYAFIDALFAYDGQPTVADMPGYPQFLIYTVDGKLVGLTTENDYGLFSTPYKGVTVFERIRLIILDLITVIKLIFTGALR